MKIFLSWSGGKSKFIAESLRWWLPRVIQSLKPWMSNEDISAGSRWLNSVSGELAEAKLGIICVTPENQNSPWLLFESGALSKVIDETYVCPLLIDITPGQLTGPLAQFQANQFGNEGIWRIVSALNRLLGASEIPAQDLREIFDVWWPRLEERVRNAPKLGEIAPRRTQEDMLEEIIFNTREQIRRENLRTSLQKEEAARSDKLAETMENSLESMQAIFNNMKAFTSLLENLGTGRTSSSREVLFGAMKAVGSKHMPDLQQMLVEMKKSAESQRSFADDILKDATAENASSNGPNKNDHDV